MGIIFLNKEYIFSNNSFDYLVLFRDLKGNVLYPIEGYITMDDLEKAKEVAPNLQTRFKDIIDSVLIIMKKEKVEERLLTLIKRLKKSSNFNWTDLEKFKKFDKVYIKILAELKEMT